MLVLFSKGLLGIVIFKHDDNKISFGMRIQRSTHNVGAMKITDNFVL